MECNISHQTMMEKTFIINFGGYLCKYVPCVVQVTCIWVAFGRRSEGETNSNYHKVKVHDKQKVLCIRLTTHQYKINSISVFFFQNIFLENI